ncbi:MAG: c-type cytochrome [Dehalococcoidia bacterium]|nr:c-type cytochrome [Dehalococcoidia bacterium]
MLPRERIPGLPISLLQRIKELPRWVWFILAIAVIPPLTTPVVGLARYTTSSSEFCLSCHGAGDTPDRSVKSVVHPGFDKVSCVDCHAKHGQIVYEGYVKGFAAEPERVSVNCVRCHEAVPLRNDAQGFKFNFSDITITHKSHLERGATCAACHSNVAHDLSVPQTNRPRMETCSQCHAVSESCVKCHVKGPPPGAAPVPAPERSGLETDGRILYLRTCSACHGTRGDQIERRKLNSLALLEERGDQALFSAIAEGHGPMPGFGVSKGGHLSYDQIMSIIGYLKVLASTPTGPIPAQAIFESRCIVCHGQDGNKMEGVRLGDPQFLDAWGDALLIQAINEGKGGMPAFFRDRGGPLSRQEIDAVLAYLKSLGKKGAAPQSGQGKELYAKSCANCHGEKGDGLPSANLAAKVYLEGRGQGELVKVTEEGKGGMPGFGPGKGGSLSREQIAGIVQYLLGAAK